MGRHVKHVTIDAEGRDLGKVFILTEMPATVGKPWVMRVTTLLSSIGVVDIHKLGKAESVAAVAMVLDDPALIQWRDCVKFNPAPNMMPQAIIWDQPTCQIEEISTVTLLQAMVVELHLGFTPPVSRSTTG